MSLPHALSEFWSRPRSSCFSSLIGTILVSKIPSCVFIILTIGFLVCLHIRVYRQADQRCWFLCLWWHSDSLGVCHTTYRSSPLLLLGQGWWWPLGASSEITADLTKLPEIIAQMLTALCRSSWGKEVWTKYRRRAMNYRTVGGELCCGRLACNH